MKPGPAVGQQLGPIGVNIGQVVSKVNEATSNFKGMKVPVILDIDTKTKEFTVTVSSPPTSELLKKEIGIEKAANDKKKEIVGNASIEQMIKVAQIKHDDMLSRDLKASVKSVIGTCASMGILVESKPALEIQAEIDSGDFDTEINNQKTETPAEKAEALKAHFTEISEQQEAAKAEEEAAAKEAEEEKAKEEAAKTEGTAPADGAAPADAATPEAGVAPAEAKSEEKKA